MTPPTPTKDDKDQQEEQDLIAKNPDLFKLIKIAMKQSFKDDFSPRLDDIQNDLQKVTFRLDNVEQDLEEHCTKFDKGFESLALRIVDQEVHARKWHLIITGLPGPVHERPADTRQKILDFGESVFCENHRPLLTACHRLGPIPDAKIIVAFMSLEDRDFWMNNAKKIKSFNTANKLRVSLQPDLPPPLRTLQSELLRVKANLSIDLRKQSFVKYSAHWPYLYLLTKNNGNRETTNHTGSKASLLKAVMDK